MSKPLLRIGTRGSPLALIQAEAIRSRLATAHADLAAPGALEVVTIRTTGDVVRDRTLAAIGGKGHFTKEIEAALLAGEIDLAVHSLKDMATQLPEGLAISCHLPRADPRDAFVSTRAPRLLDLPRGAVVGSSALRRQAQILRARPDLRVVPLRGNVETRLGKVSDGKVDATLLAVAGLARLGLESRITELLPTDLMLPAPAQGTIAVETRAKDERLRRYLAPIDDAATAARSTEAISGCRRGSSGPTAQSATRRGSGERSRMPRGSVARPASGSGRRRVRASSTCRSPRERRCEAADHPAAAGRRGAGGAADGTRTRDAHRAPPHDRARPGCGGAARAGARGRAGAALHQLERRRRRCRRLRAPRPPAARGGRGHGGGGAAGGLRRGRERRGRCRRAGAAGDGAAPPGRGPARPRERSCGGGRPRGPPRQGGVRGPLRAALPGGRRGGIERAGRRGVPGGPD